MRGGAQSSLVEATDGHFYVVKAVNNPQHRRILINEWISSAALHFLGIASPPVEIVEFSPDFLAANPDVYFRSGSSQLRPDPGWHFGSRFPCDPAKNPVYDFFPDALIEKIHNLNHFAGTLAFDKWLGNCAARQAIFHRDRHEDQCQESMAHRLKTGFLAQMIDNGQVFGGATWQLMDSSIHPFHPSSAVYRNFRDLEDFEPWLSRIVNFPVGIFEQAAALIPKEWLAGDEEALAVLLAQARRRRDQVPNLLEAAIGARTIPREYKRRR